MFGFQSPKTRPGRRILAGAINRPAELVERMARSQPGGTLSTIDVGGTQLNYPNRPTQFLIRITAVGTSSQYGQYSWQAIYAVPGSPGTYADLHGWSGSLGGDAFYEDNAVGTLAVGDRVEVERDYYSGTVRGQYAHC